MDQMLSFFFLPLEISPIASLAKASLQNARAEQTTLQPKRA